MCLQRRIQNPVTHRKQLTAETVIKNADAEQRQKKNQNKIKQLDKDKAMKNTFMFR